MRKRKIRTTGKLPTHRDATKPEEAVAKPVSTTAKLVSKLDLNGHTAGITFSSYVNFIYDSFGFVNQDSEATWRVLDTSTEPGALMLQALSAPLQPSPPEPLYLPKNSPPSQLSTFTGVPVIIDPSLGDDEVRFVEANKSIHISKQHYNRLFGSDNVIGREDLEDD